MYLMNVTEPKQPKKTYKTFRYYTNLRWVGDRAGMMHSTGKPEFRVASPPEFKGEEGVWTPEDMFVAAVETCTMTTFLAFAFNKKLPLHSYESRAEGKLEFVDGGYRFTEVLVKPVITLHSEDAIDEAHRLMHAAHEKCLIANSVHAKVEVELEIRIA
jgi:organic hydroperoxide reductase OsmC/OhrA